jgi:VanZ family protein
MLPRPSLLLRTTCLVAAFAVAAVVLYESTQERGRPGIPEVSTNLAYAGHFAIYGLMTLLAVVAVAPRSPAAFAIVILTATGLGIAMELYQIHLTTRTASAGDAFADSAGALSAVAAYFALTVLFEAPNRGRPTRV